MTDRKATQKIVAENPISRIESRFVPVSPIKITATTFATAQLVHTCPDAEINEFRSINISNVSNADVACSLYIVPNGETLSDDHLVISDMVITANTIEQLQSYFLIGSGWRIYAFAGTANSIRVTGWIKAHL